MGIIVLESEDRDNPIIVEEDKAGVLRVIMLQLSMKKGL